MTTVLVVFALLVAVAGFFVLIGAEPLLGVGLLVLSCFVAILAQLCQAARRARKEDQG